VRWVLVALALCACARHAERAPDKPPDPHPSPLAGNDQLVTAVIDDWSATKATMRHWHREGGAWKPVGEAWPAVIGHAGAAWGDGLHGSGAPAGRTGPVKQEGDGKSPAGAFALTSAFGYGDAPEHTQLPYRRADAESVCVDDPASHHYGEIGDLPEPHDWKSAEKLRRDDELYELGVVVDHNAAHVARHGSCIFLHVWGGPASTTVGCTAMAKPQLAQLLGTLSGKPLFVLLPRDEYRALSEPWGLPPQ
jgi:L,D-peptidoglycan transpeptidase YkuD (ErfK/YbiS/YcfS/YnhG family)